jgi:uncharacterized membrane-anchored protein
VLGFSYVIVVAFWFVVLAVILVSWRASGETLSPGSVCSGREELFYWVAAGSGFALSAAATYGASCSWLPR